MTKTGYEPLTSIEAVTEGLSSVGYISTPQISTAIYLAHHLRKPVLIEGPAGVGKTDLAQSMAKFLNIPLTRMQCYEGLDDAKALYEWKYGKQLLYTQILKEKLHDVLGDADTLAASFDKLGGFEDLFFSHDFLEPRPLLRAMQQDKGSVLLIDEIDKSDEEFEAFLLEVLSDYQVSDSGDRDNRGEDTPSCNPHFQQCPRTWRCAETPLSSPAYRISGRRPRTRDRQSARARH